MKVEQNNGFNPIIITLETYEEACAMWHQLAIDTKEQDQSNKGYDNWRDDDTAFDIFGHFDNVFRPGIK